MRPVFFVGAGDPAPGLADRLGTRVLPFPSPASALAAGETEPPDAVILDLRAHPEGVRPLADGLRVPLVVLAASVDDPRGWEAMEEGASDCAGAEEGPEGLARAVLRSLARRRWQGLLVSEPLVQSQRMESLGRLTGGIAHDFNNLLGVILTHSEMLLKEWGPSAPAAARDDLTAIREAAEAGRDLVTSLVAFARRSRLAPRLQSLGAILQAELPSYQRLLRDDVRLTLEVAPDLPDVLTDATALHQVLLNLLTNAQDAMPLGGAVHVTVGQTSVTADGPGQSVRAPGRYVTIRVKDEGIGMTPEVLRNAFDPLFTTKARDRGTGLGLAVAVGLMRQQGGTIDATSEPGSGTEMTMAFPVPSREAAPLDVPPSVGVPANTAPAPVPPRPLVVLLAEDNRPLRRAGRRIMEAAGFEVVEVEDGVEALEVFDARGGAVDLVISDLMMPRMGGGELYRQLRERKPTLPFILSSGHVDPSPDDRDAIPDDVPYIVKPWTGEILVSKAREVLGIV